MGLTSSEKRQGVGIPTRVFFFTIEQISTMLNVGEGYLISTVLHFDGRSIGAHKKDMILATNVAPLGETPKWRVSEVELIRWCRFKNIRIYERGWAQP